MMKFFKRIFDTYQLDEVEDYYANSISLEDLERRQREVEKGEAPFQRRRYPISFMHY